MERKKQQRNHEIEDYCSNKKQKLQNKITIINTKFQSIFEDLANEILYEIFDYLDIYQVYQGFFDLSKRFQNLLLNSNLPLQVNISTMSKSNFERYHKNIIIPHKHRINYLRLSNPFTVNIVLSPPGIITKFTRLDSLILDKINGKYLYNILNHAIHLPNLRSLVINLIDYVQNPSILFFHIFSLPKLKYCKIKYETKDNPPSLYMSADKYSSIEHLVINARFRFASFYNLLTYLPQLHYLSIDCLDGSRFIDINLCPIVLKYLKHVSLKLEFIHLNQLEKFIEYFFYSVEVLRLTTYYDPEYLNAKRWEQLILSSMPNLRIFDINHYAFTRNNSLTYHHLINQFNSSFWIEKQWFFTHQHDWEGRLNAIFYSTNPYRRKDYIFYWESDRPIRPYPQEINLNSVKHVYIGSKQATNTCRKYFPNVTELTIQYFFETPDDSISTSLNRIVPLKQLTKLVIECYHFPFEEIIQLLTFTPNLHTLQLDLLSLHQTNLKLLEQNETFKYVSKTNKIKYLNIRDVCTLEKIQLIVTLFPQLEYFKTQMNRKEIEHIIRFLLLKSNNKSCHLFFLCISETPKICLRELNVLIKSENLIDDYFIKFVNQDLYLWW